MPTPLEATMFAIIPEHPEPGDGRAELWPHIEVVPWVQLGEWRHEVFEEVDKIVRDTAPVVLEPRGMTTVRGERAQKIFSPELKELHTRLLYCLGSFGIVVAHPELIGPKYKSHIVSDHLMLRRVTAVDTIYAVENTRLTPEDKQGTKLVVQTFESKPR